MRSLFGRLRRRFGQRRTGAELRRRADLHFERLSTAMPTRPLLEPRLWQQPVSPGKVAVIGAGFAGFCAAYESFRAGFEVTLFETTEKGIGGRVKGTSDVVLHRTLEMGAELIGANHPFWMCYARQFGLGLSVVTTEDRYDAAGLRSPFWLKGKLLDYDTQKSLYTQMEGVFSVWCNEALTTLPSPYPWEPWVHPEAADLDAKNLGEMIPTVDPRLAAALSTQFYLDNCVDPARQSWLANLAQFSAGSSPGSDDSLGFFDDTEVFRCENANQTLAFSFRAALPPNTLKGSITINGITVDGKGVSLSDTDRRSYGPYDYAILAVPVSKYPDIQLKVLNDPDDPGLPVLAHGPAVKYLAPLENRFWITNEQAPSGMSDELGMTWEGTDNQMMDREAGKAKQYDMSVFVGGQLAQTAIDKGGTNEYFVTLLKELYADMPEVKDGTFVNWPKEKNIGTGYSCPAVKEVTGIQKIYSKPKGGRLFLAGEHTSPAWFGYMEGALQSGHMAVMRMCQAAGIDVAKWGCTAAL